MSWRGENKPTVSSLVPFDNAMIHYPDYISAIRFRFLQPGFRIPIPEDRYERRLETILRRGRIGWLERLGTWFEFINTVLPTDRGDALNKLKMLCRMPRMSSLAIGALIAEAVRCMPEEEAFVNIGVWQGFTLLSGMLTNPCKKCIGVDNFSEFGGPRDAFMNRFLEYRTEIHHFYDMDYETYFSEIHQGFIGFYIYDASHAYSDQLRGLRVAEPFFSETCIVMVDDTNWQEPRQATLDFIAGSRSRYKILLDVKTRHNCHPTFWNGLIIFQRVA